MKTLLMMFGALVAAWQPNATEWAADPVHSRIQFRTTHMGLAQVWGTFDDYSVHFSPKNPLGNDFTDSKLQLEIHTQSVNTGVMQRDEHLRSIDFLHVKEYPNMVFVAQSFKKKKSDLYQVKGTLTLRGVTKPVQLDVKAGKVTTGFDGEKRIGFSAETKLNRKDFGINFNAPMDNGDVLIGEIIDIFISMEFTQPALQPQN